MSDIHKSTRLGDLLVERGTITRHQLLRAIEAQQERRFNALHHVAGVAETKELGEILIELGYINRTQLDSSLSWQRKLRKTTLVMAFIAPLLTAACGGGASSSNNNTGSNTQSNTVSSQSISATNSSANQFSSTAAMSSSSAPAAVSSSSVARSSSAPASSSSSSQASGIDGPAVIYWSVPTQRENGDYLDITEIGGYKLRYKLASASEFTSITIDSGFTDTYYFDYLQGDYVFEIATFDVNGLYSEFVSIHPIE
jgi:hypothetical protein